ncbi:hypothetical protein AK830_g12541 [Neonectria ditissima]|uniref:Uncharacterized protein n=1 Tax=Neonectria ditissima TaxID=78410 RepID=A0A0P7B381_9HYPO|nr:hypothetical protein AK830_g12541 [Neonectria ditissima]
MAEEQNPLGIVMRILACLGFRKPAAPKAESEPTGGLFTEPVELPAREEETSGNPAVGVAV